MEEIKFRVWDEDNQNFDYFSFNDIENIQTIINFYNLYFSRYYFKTNPEYIMQYTGLKDGTKWKELSKSRKSKWLDDGNIQEGWNGIEIYKNDILGINGEPFSIVESVMHNDFPAGYTEKYLTPQYPTPGALKIERVMGNIFENPEILKK